MEIQKQRQGQQKLTNSVFNKLCTDLSIAVDNNIYTDSISQFAYDKNVLFENKTQMGDPPIVSTLHYFCIMES